MLYILPRIAFISGLLLLLGIGSVRAQTGGAGDKALTGYWVYTIGTTTFTVGFVPDGRYVLETQAGGPTQYEYGNYRVANGKLTLKTVTQPAVTYDLTLAGDQLTVSGGPFPNGVTFVKKPGSETTILEDARKLDAAKAAEDAAARQRIKVGPMAKNAAHHNFAIGDVPVDPKPLQIFPNPTVFTSHQAYYHLDLPKTVVFTDGRQTSVSDSWKWAFYPDGRVFVRSVSYRENGPDTGQIFTMWGRYTIQPGGKEETIRIETDKGEKLTVTLIDGRRNLLWKDELYHQLQ